MSNTFFRSRENFSLPLVTAVASGSFLSATFYALLIYGPINNPLVNRLCFSHPAAAFEVWFFFMALSGLTLKWTSTMAQRRLTGSASMTLEHIVLDGEDILPVDRAEWLENQWLSQSHAIRNSWLGRRVTELVERQIKRGKRTRLENDIQDLARSDRLSQHDSLALIRMATWAILLLGLLGTVLSASYCFSPNSSHDLASQAQSETITWPTNLVASLDTTTLALFLVLSLTVVQFVVNQLESTLLKRIDFAIHENLLEFLGSDPFDAEKGMLGPVRQMASDLITAVHQLVEQQASLWGRSINESQKQWTTWSDTNSDQLRRALTESLDKSLSNHAMQIEKIQQDAARQVDSRWQQWQITLSDQARVMHGQQKELVRQTEAIDRLIQSTTELKKLEEVVRESFSGFDHLERLRQASLGVGEAVAFLATSLERAGIIRGAPVKPRANRKSDESNFSIPIESSDQRKAA